MLKMPPIIFAKMISYFLILFSELYKPSGREHKGLIIRFKIKLMIYIVFSSCIGARDNTGKQIKKKGQKKYLSVSYE